MGNSIHTIDGLGENNIALFHYKHIGCRPVIQYSLIKHYINNNDEFILDNGNKLMSFGEYPQMVVKNLENYVLEEKYKNNELNKTSLSFTLKDKKYEVYECNGRKFIRYVSDIKSSSTLSNYETIKKDKVYYIEVKPIDWLVDEEKDIAISNFIICGGMNYSNDEYFFDSFEDSIVGNYLNNVFLDEITEYANLIKIQFQKNMLINIQEELKDKEMMLTLK